MKDEKKDSYDIKKFEEVLGESQMMIPDSISRRDKASVDLREFVSTLEKDEVGNNELMSCECNCDVMTFVMHFHIPVGIYVWITSLASCLMYP